MNAITTTTQASAMLATSAPAVLVTSSPLPADEHPAIALVNSRAPGQSRVGTIRSLNAIAGIVAGDSLATVVGDEFTGERYQFVRWERLRHQHVAAIRARLMEHYKPSSANTHLTNLKNVIKQAWKLGLIGEEEYKRSIDVDRVAGSTLPAGRDVSMGELMALVNVCENDASPSGVRDAAIIGLMAFVAGCRRTEVVTLDLDDYSPADGRLLIRGKRNKEREAWATNGVKRALDEWLEIRGDEPGPLFCPVNKGGRVIVRRMTSQAIYNMLADRGRQAKIGRFSPHDLRRTIIGDMLDDGTDIATVAQIVGHSSVTTTQRYDRRPKERIKQAIARRHFPYRGKSDN